MLRTQAIKSLTTRARQADFIHLVNMERFILRLVREKGELRAGSQAYEALHAEYPAGSERETAMVFVEYLTSERYLLPFISNKRGEIRHDARGITPKGVDRLFKLEHPYRHWIANNWFPFILGMAVAGIGIADLIAP